MIDEEQIESETQEAQSQDTEVEVSTDNNQPDTPEITPETATETPSEPVGENGVELEPKVEKSPSDLPSKASKESFEPKIIAFLCNWCSYAGADLCGVSRYQYPTNIRVIRVMCSTRIDPALIIEMFIQGADAVLVGGCHLGDCHYISQN